MFKTNRLIKELFAQYEVAMKPLREIASKFDWNKELDGMEQIARIGAKNGWTLPPHTTFRECHDMIKNKSKAEMDSEFKEHYAITKNYEDMKSRLINGVFKRKWGVLLNQCFDNYECENYQIVIPSLFLILEGAVFDIVKDFVIEGRWKVAFKMTGKQIKQESIKRPVFVSVKDFLFKAYEYGDFETATERPPLINRSWVLHGRDDIREWKKIDAIRLFNALYSLTFLYSTLTKKEDNE